jgi:prepilin-type N-terminal cleavage/methylation domain-containing protein
VRRREAPKQADRSFSARPARRGFTLVELLVAMAAGLMVATAAYALAKNALDVFQNESRGFSAQFSAMSGMTRLAADVRRAGFMTSANSAADPFRCGDMPGGQDQRRLSALVLVRGGSGSYTDDPAVTGSANYDAIPAVYTSTENNRKPDRVRLAGNFATTEIFDLATYDATDGGTFKLQTDSPAVQRVYDEWTQGGTDICDMFAPTIGAGPGRSPRYATVTTAAGQTFFVKVTNCVPTDSGSSYDGVTITWTPIQTATRCTEAPKTIAPTVLIEYFLANIASAADATATGLDASAFDLTQPVQAAVTGDGDRMELVRREINADGGIVAGSGEIVAEYAVDLKLAFRTLQTAPPAVPFFSDFDASDIGPAETNLWDQPQRLRSAVIRLSTRARTADREDLGSAAGPATPEPLKRFAIFDNTNTIKLRFARVRTLQTEVALPNLAGLVW